MTEAPHCTALRLLRAAVGEVVIEGLGRPMRWMWIDQIVEHQPRQRLVAIKNVSLAEDHLQDHFPAGGGPDGTYPLPIMPATLMIEGMAQTAGILVGACSDFAEKVILAKIVSANIEQDVTPGQTIRYTATLTRFERSGASAEGTIERLQHCGSEPAAWEQIGSVELMFSHIDQNAAGVKFPDDNFVFSDNFRFILAAAGLQDLITSE